MANAITGDPNQYDFGYEFDYSVWTPGTQIDFVNVPWNNDYRDVVKFDNRTALDTYINGLQPAGIRLENLSYVRPNTPIRVDIPHNRAIRYNYLRASNPIQPIPGNDIQKSFYYFILDAKYIAPNTTELVLQLDTWQTFIYDCTFGNCYIERGHIGIANTKQFDNYGRDYLTVPEGFDLGSDYASDVSLSASHTYMSVASTQHDIVALSTVDLIESGGSVNDPVLKTAPGSSFQRLPSGASFYAWSSVDMFKAWLKAKQDQPWVTQGIISVMILPELSDFIDNINSVPAQVNPTRIDDLGVGTSVMRSFSLKNNWRDAFEAVIPSRYSSLKKFLTYPYSLVELTTFTGDSLILKPELWQSNNASIVKRASFIPPSVRVTFSPSGYNERQTITPDSANDLLGESWATSISVSNFPTLPVVNNMAINYLASNKNSISWQNASADWSQQRALASAQASYDIMTGAIGTASDITDIGVRADYGLTNTALDAARMNTAIQIGGNVVGSLPFGPAGMVNSLAHSSAQAGQALVSRNAEQESLAIRSNASRSTTSRQNQQTALQRDTNKGLADWAARGDYANTIAGINAKVQDAKMTQPSMSATYGGEMFNIINNMAKLYMRVKMVDKRVVSQIGDYWLRYGYAVQRFITPPASLKVMSKFTYWKMLETYIKTSNVPEGYKQAIRGMLEKGVTVWNNPSEIGAIDLANNTPLGGISY